MDTDIQVLRYSKLVDLENQMKMLIQRKASGIDTVHDQANYRSLSLECTISHDVNPTGIQFSAEFSVENAEMIHKAIKIAIAIASAIGLGVLISKLLDGGSSGGGGGSSGLARAQEIKTQAGNLASEIATPVSVETKNGGEVVVVKAAPKLIKTQKKIKDIQPAVVSEIVNQAYTVHERGPDAVIVNGKVIDLTEEEKKETPETEYSKAVKNFGRHITSAYNGFPLRPDGPKDVDFKHFLQTFGGESFTPLTVLNDPELLASWPTLRFVGLYAEVGHLTPELKAAKAGIIAIHAIAESCEMLFKNAEEFREKVHQIVTTKDFSLIKESDYQETDEDEASLDFLVKGLDHDAAELLVKGFSSENYQWFLTEEQAKTAKITEGGFQACDVMADSIVKFVTTMSRIKAKEQVDKLHHDLFTLKQVIEDSRSEDVETFGKLIKLAEQANRILKILSSAVNLNGSLLYKQHGHIRDITVILTSFTAAHASLLAAVEARQGKPAHESLLGGHRFSTESDIKQAEENAPVIFEHSEENMKDDFVHDSPELLVYNQIEQKDRAIVQAHAKILSGVATDEDFRTVSSIALESPFTQHLRFNPRYISRAIATENVGNLHKAIKIALVIAGLGVLAAIIRHFIKKSDDEQNGSSINESAETASNAPVNRVSNPASHAIPGIVAKLDDLLKSALAVEVAKEKFVQDASQAIQDQYKDRITEANANNVAARLYDLSMYLRKVYALDDIKGVPGYADLLNLWDGRAKVSQIIASKAIVAKYAFLRYPILYRDSAPASEKIGDKELKDYFASIRTILNCSNGANGAIDITDFMRKVAHDPSVVSDSNAGSPFNTFVATYSKDMVDSAGTSVRLPQTSAQADPDAVAKVSNKIKAEFTLLDASRIETDKVIQALTPQNLKMVIDLADEAHKFKKDLNGVLAAIPAIEEILNDATSSGFTGKLKALETTINNPSALDADKETAKEAHRRMDLALKSVRGWIDSVKSVGNTLIGATVSVTRIETGLEDVIKNIVAVGKVIGDLEAAINTAFTGSATIPQGKVADGKQPVQSNATTTESLQQQDPSLMPTMDPDNPEFIPDESIRMPDGLDITAINELDFENMEDTQVFQTSDGLTEAQEDMNQDLIALESVLGQIRANGMSQALAKRLEEIQPGLLTKRIPLNRFTSFESATYREFSLEEGEGLAKGMKIAGLAIGAIFLVKIVSWMVSRWGRLTDKTTAVAGNISDADANIDKAYKVLGDLNHYSFSDQKAKDVANNTVGSLIPTMVWNFNDNPQSFEKAKLLAFKGAFTGVWCLEIKSFADSQLNSQVITSFDKAMQGYMEQLQLSINTLQGFINQANSGTNTASISMKPMDFSEAVTIAKTVDNSLNGDPKDILSNLVQKVKANTAVLQDGSMTDDYIKKLVDQLRKNGPQLVKDMNGRSAKDFSKLMSQVNGLKAAADKYQPKDATTKTELTQAADQLKQDATTIGLIVSSQDAVIDVFGKISAQLKVGANNLLGAVNAVQKAGTKT